MYGPSSRIQTVFSRTLFSLFVLVAMGLTGCSRGYYKYDSTVSTDQQNLIETDMGRIGSFDMTARTQDDLNTLQISDLQGSTLVSWLKKRNRVVVGEDYDWQGDNLVSKQKILDTPQLLLNASVDGNTRVGAGSTITVMVNLGAAIYLDSVDDKVVYTVRAAGDDIRVWSPASAGLIQVGEGLFNQMITSSPVDSYAHTIRRFSTYLHEATHTLGNGDHRAFAHAQCPSDFSRKEFQGVYACEKYLNGPYARQVLILGYAIPALCPTNGCTSAEQDALLKTYSDYYSRQLPGISFVDPTPEGFAAEAYGDVIGIRLAPELGFP